MYSFNNKDIILITGASSGIGKAIALELNSLGANVIATGRNFFELQKSKDLSSNKDLFQIEHRDIVEDIDENLNWINSIVEKYGALKSMILCAGIDQTLPIQTLNYSRSKLIFDTNFFANEILMRAFSKKKNNQGNGSSIICISSIMASLTSPAIANYSASKAALESLVRTAALEFATNGIRVNAIAAGHIITHLLTNNETLPANFIDNLKSKYPLGLGEPIDIANAVAFLISDNAKWITGTTLTIDGGVSVRF